MNDCKWNADGICVNADCPMRADFCPVPDEPGVCRHEDRGESKPMKIYIAGKIAGNPNYKEEFRAAQAELEAQGYIVLNPATLPEGMTPADYMGICFAMIDCADELWALPSWSRSRGAAVEIAYCNYAGKPVRYMEASSNE